MNGVLLVNMGGPGSLKEMKIFLANMFKDPFILPFSKPIRHLLSFIISNIRYRHSWKKYKLIGGTPIIRATQKTADTLQQKLGIEYKVKIAFSYSPPFIGSTLTEFQKENISDIIVIPLYPQSSYSTTTSVKTEVRKKSRNLKDLNLRFINEFYKHERFIEFWAFLINRHISENNYKHPFLLFSAHSIPTYLVERGDSYPWSIGESSSLISKKAGVKFDYAYQSGMKKGEWLKPDVKERLRELSEKGVDEIVIVPLSFVNENLETLYDIDHEIVPYAKNDLKIKSISRVRIPEANELFVEMLSDLVIKSF